MEKLPLHVNLSIDGIDALATLIASSWMLKYLTECDCRCCAKFCYGCPEERGKIFGMCASTGGSWWTKMWAFR